MGPVLNTPRGGTLEVERQLMTILRRYVQDPGIDDPNARDASGHGAIRDATETLTGRRLPHTEIIPLMASLTASEQQRAFKLSYVRLDLIG